MTRGTRVSSETGEPVIAVWPVALGLIAVTLLLSLTAHPGVFANDNRFIQFWDPVRWIQSVRTTWSTDANMGGVSAAQGIGLYAYSAALQALGAPAWLIERLTHATLIAGGAVGTVLLTREFIPRHRIAHLVAGLWWIVSPVTTGYLIPSSLYINAAVCPWLCLAVLRGSTSSSRWRWAAGFALAIGVAGTANPPTLLLAALPLVPLVIYLVVTRQSSTRAVAAFAARTAPLVAAVLAFELYRARLMSRYFAQTLALSEDRFAVSRSSSWSESLRGLGRWDSYVSFRGGPLKPSVTALLHDPKVVIASFVPVAIALGVIAFSRRRAVALLGCVLLLSAIVMVGAFPLDDASPYGRALFWLYDAVPSALVFRNGYKAAAGLLLATCMLLAFAVAAVSSWRPRGRRLGSVHTAGAVVGTVLVMIATATPLWTGAIYTDQRSLEEVPAYWLEAMAWLDAQPGSSRVFIVPGATQTEMFPYGPAADGGLFATYLHRPFILPAPLAQLAPDADDVISGVSRTLSLGRYEQGSIGPIAHRLGIGYIMLRNDAAWEFNGSARPLLYDAVRSDPALVLDATFGRVGENVVAADDTSLSGGLERGLPPVQIYRVRGDNEPVRAVSGPSVLVSGNGEAWPALARDGVLDHAGPIRYTGRLTAQDLDDELRGGASVVITDTNRRRQPSQSLAPGATMSGTQPGPAVDLFARAGSQTVQTYPDAVDIRGLAPPSIGDEGVEHGPAAAFDGDPSTTFVSGRYYPLRGEDALRVRLKRPTPLSEMSIDATAAGGRRVTKAEISFPDASSVPIDLSSGRATVTFPAHVVDQFDVRVTELSAEPNAESEDLSGWTIKDITVPGVDLAAEIQMPDDVFRLAETNQQLRERLATAPLSYRFHRLQDARPDEEATLRRRFRVLSSRTFNGSGTVQLRASATSTELDTLLGVPNASPATTLSTACHQDLVTIDGAPLGIELTGTVEQLRSGQPIAVKLCTPLDLADGWHSLDSVSAAPLSDFTIAAISSTAPGGPVVERPLTATWASETDARVEMDGSTRLILGQAAFEGWRATANGRQLAAPIELDAQLAWEVPDAGTTTVRARFSPQRIADLMLLISAAGLLACIALAIVDPGSASATGSVARTTRGRHFATSTTGQWLPTVGAIAFAGLVAGLPGVVVAAGGLIVLQRRLVSRRAIGAVCVACIGAVAILYLPPIGPALGTITPDWPADRLTAHDIARAAAVLLAVLLATAPSPERQ